LAADWPGAIIIVDFIMLSDVHAIIFADAGVNAKTVSIAAAIKVLM
jgi:hypothetical protein